MKLWHYELIPYLPKQMLVSQWRECIAIKRQWEKGNLKHRLVSYVMNYDKKYFYNYIVLIILELKDRNIKYNNKYFDEIHEFCNYCGNSLFPLDDMKYKEHNDRYLKQCLYNLQEKADRGIISKDEWQIIEEKFKKYF